MSTQREEIDVEKTLYSTFILISTIKHLTDRDEPRTADEIFTLIHFIAMETEKHLEHAQLQLMRSMRAEEVSDA